MEEGRVTDGDNDGGGEILAILTVALIETGSLADTGTHAVNSVDCTEVHTQSVTADIRRENPFGKHFLIL